MKKTIISLLAAILLGAPLASWAGNPLPMRCWEVPWAVRWVRV